MRMDYDVVIVGAGPAGYMAAIRLGQLGKKVIVIDGDRLGGECLNYACIPSKTLLHYAFHYKKMRDLYRLGLYDSEPSIDIDVLRKIKDDVIDTLVKGLSHIFELYNIEFLNGFVYKVEENTVYVRDSHGSSKVSGDNVVIAVGSRPIELPQARFDNINILSSRDALNIRSIPESIAVIGGGGVGVEIASLYRMLGSEVYVIELLDRLLPFTDKDIGSRLQRAFKTEGINVYTSSRLDRVRVGDGHLILDISRGSGGSRLSVEKCVVVVGRESNADALNLVDIGIELDDKGFILVDEKQETSVSGIFAIGDVTGPPLLAHKAYWEALNFVESLYGDGPLNKPSHFPLVIFSKPEVLTIGYSEEEARELYGDIFVSKIPLGVVGRAVAEGYKYGFIKVVAEPKRYGVVGIHVLGYNASVYSSIASMVVENELTIYDIEKIVFPHPSYGEGLWEACRKFLGRAIHFTRR
jgi:dihydrolipoamide dehydrogenase